MQEADKFLAATLKERGISTPTCGYRSVVRDYSSQPEIHAPSTKYIRRAEAAPRTAPARLRYWSQRLEREVEITLMGLFVRPWAWAWSLVLLVGLISCVGSAVMANTLASSQEHLGSAILMAVCVPATVVCLFVEWDVSENVGWSEALLVAVIGGGISASIAGISNNLLGISMENSWAAALTEEPIKGAILIILLFMTKRFPGILSGLALGCAVGAGFAACETVDYAYAYSADLTPSVKVLVLRGVLSPMMHMAWTGALGGALWASRGSHGDWKRVLFSFPAWCVFACMIACHALWNGVGVVYLISIALWTLILCYVKKGVEQAFELEIVRKEGII